MDWPGVDGDSPQRRPRRASTFPARFTEPGQPQVIVEPIVPRYERRPSKPDAPTRGPMSAVEDLPDSYYVRRHGSSYADRDVPIIESSRPTTSRRDTRTRPDERRRRRHGRSRSRSRHRSVSSSEGGGSDSSSSLVSYDYDLRSSRRTQPRGRYDSSDESESEWDVNREAYTFNLSRRSRSPLSQDSTIRTSTEPSLKTEVNSDIQVGVDVPKLGTTLQVYRSKYTGEGSAGGSQSAQLNVCHDKKKSQSQLFRWIHFEDPTMHFDDLQNKVNQIPGLTDIERTGLSKLLGRVRKNYDKPLQTSKGTKVRFMEPGFMQETLSRGDRPKDKLCKARTASWLCLPYFWLGEYSGVLSASRSGAHPMRTLLQARFSLAERDRDLQQAVCNVLGTPPGFCFHIAQLWCLVLEDSLLVTCARIPKSALQGDAISVISDPVPGQSRGKAPKILVSYGASVLWSLSVDDCQTWFSLISNFLEFWPRKFRILYNDKVVTAQDWPKILELANHTNHGIRLALQMGSIHKISTRGILNSSPRSPIPSSSTTSDLNTAALNRDRTFQASAPFPDVAAEHTGHPFADVDKNQNQRRTKDEGIPNPSASRTTALGSSSFHVLTWLNTAHINQNGRISNVDVQQLEKDLEDMDYFLSHKTTLVERIAYKECPQVSRLEVYGLLEQEERTLVESAVREQKQDARKPRMYELRVDIVNAAESIFQFFLPSLFEGPTVLKYWGVIHQVLVASSPGRPSEKQKGSRRRPKVENFHPTERELEEIGGELEAIVRHAQPFIDLLSQAQAADRSEIKISDELIKAWLHIIMSLINYTRDSSLWEDQMNTCADLIEEGMKKVVQSLNRKSLQEKSVFMPFEVTSLINFQLLQDLTGTQSDDISEIYSSYLKGLEAGIEANPLDRGHQDKITLLKQEMSVITETLEKQRQIFAAITTSTHARNSSHKVDEGRKWTMSYERDHDRTRSTREAVYSKSHAEPGYRATYNSAYPAPQLVIDNVIHVENAPRDLQSQLSPTDPGGYRDLLLQDCCDLIDKRRQDFDGMNRKASDLEAWNMQRIDSNKDRQESAIYAFTIVTIVFLPLSTVASIMGMNTNDIRNMRLDQWVFWAVAVPLASIVITLCLLWAGEWGNLRRGFVQFWQRRGARGGYAGARGGYGIGSVGYAGGEQHAMARSRLAIELDELELERERGYARPRVRERSDLYGNRSYAYV